MLGSRSEMSANPEIDDNFHNNFTSTLLYITSLLRMEHTALGDRAQTQKSRRVRQNDKSRS